MSPLSTVSLAEITLCDERSFRHVAVYAELKRALVTAGVRFLVPAAGSDLRADDARLLNLAFWSAGDVAEVLPEPRLAADQLAHNAWHHLAARALGPAAQTADGMLLGEAIASAFDVYLVGRLLGHAPESEFLETQVPAMSDAALAAGLDEAGFERLLARMAAEPERCFEELRRLLFDTATALCAAADLAAAAVVLARAAAEPLAPLLHHYELPTWVLYARAYAISLAPSEPVRAVDRELRAAADPVAWLERAWLGE